MQQTSAQRRGFTLIELLVVIAIIGLLASVIFAALDSSRVKSREARRLADIRSLQNAIEIYYINNTNYSTTLAGLVTGNAISAVPTDPLTKAAYTYVALGSGTSCTSYHLGAIMEVATTPAIANDLDAIPVGNCTGGGTDFDGTSVACTAAAASSAPAGTERCYDVKP